MKKLNSLFLTLIMLFLIVLLPKSYAIDLPGIVNVFGSKNNIVVEFDINATVENVTISDQMSSMEACTFEMKDNKVMISLEKELKIDKRYILGIKTQDAYYEKYIWFNKLLDEDFSAQDETKNKFYFSDWNSLPTLKVENGRLIRNKILNTYATSVIINNDNKLWKDYTVEFDYLGSEKEGAFTSGINLETFFYIKSNTPTLNEGDGKAVYNTMVGVRTNITKATDLKYSASIFENQIFSRVTNLNTDEVLFKDEHTTVKGGNNSQSGAFGFSGYNGWNDKGTNVIDNVLCYKLEYSDLEYTSNVITGEKNWAPNKDIFFDWNIDLQNYPEKENIIIKDAKGNVFENFIVRNSDKRTILSFPNGLDTTTPYVISFVQIYDVEGEELNLQPLSFTTANIYKSFRVDAKTSLKKGEVAVITAWGTTDKSEDKEIEVGKSLLKYESSNPNIIAVENGVLTAKSYGSSYIKVTLENADGVDLTASFLAYVFVKENELTVINDGKIADISYESYVLEADFNDDGVNDGYIGFDENKFLVKSDCQNEYYSMIINSEETLTNIRRSKGKHKIIIIKDISTVSAYIDGEKVKEINAEEYKFIYAQGSFSNIKFSRTNDTVPKYTISISGNDTNNAEIGKIFTATLNYSDQEEDPEDGSVYGWYMSDSLDGTFSRISSELSLKILSEYNGKYIRFQAVASNSVSIGAEVSSNSFKVVVGEDAQNAIDSIECSDAYFIGKTLKKYKDIFDIDMSFTDSLSKPLYIYEELAEKHFVTPKDVKVAFDEAVKKYKDTIDFLGKIKTVPEQMGNNVDVNIKNICIEFPNGVSDKRFIKSNFSIKDSKGNDVPFDIADGKLKIATVLDSGMKYTVLWNHLSDKDGNSIINEGFSFTTQCNYTNIESDVKTYLKVGEETDLSLIGYIDVKKQHIHPSVIVTSVSDNGVIKVENGKIKALKRGISFLTAESEGQKIKIIITVYNKKSDKTTSEFPVEFITENVRCATDTELNIGSVILNVSGGKIHQLAFAINGENATIYLDGNEMGTILKSDVMKMVVPDLVKKEDICYMNLSGEKCFANYVAIRGDLSYSGEYKYNDADNDVESGSLYEWYYSFNADGTYTKISGETKKTLSAIGYEGCYIKFGVTPANIYECGETIMSEPIKVPLSNSGSTTAGGGGGNSGGVSISKSTLDKEDTTTVKKDVFSDVSETHWAYKSIKNMKEKGVINGFEDGTYKPDKTVTRAEFICSLSKALNITSSEYHNIFNDVKSENWYAPYVQAVYNIGYIKGDGGFFNPDNEITREQMAVIIARIINVQEKSELTFKDNDSISEWAKESVSKVMAKKIMTGNEQGEFNPLSATTRAQMAAIMERILAK